MMRRWLVVAAVLAPCAACGLAVPSAAWAQAAPRETSAQKFAAVLQNAGHRRDVLADARGTPAWVALGCRTAVYAEAAEVAVYAPVKFDLMGAPVTGEWREGVVATGCGQKMQLNVLTEVTAPSTLATGALLPGATIADPDLQNVAQGFAVKAAGGLPAGCRDAYVANTAFLGFLGAHQAAGWREDWTLYLCGAVKTVGLQFAPGAQGISLAVISVR